MNAALSAIEGGTMTGSDGGADVEGLQHAVSASQHRGNQERYAQQREPDGRVRREPQDHLQSDQVEEDLPDPSEAVLRPPEASWPMVDDDLVEPPPRKRDQRCDEAVHVGKKNHPLDDLAPIRPECAAAVVDADSGQATDEPVGRPRWQLASDQGILARSSPTADYVEPSIQPRDEPRNIVRVVLEIAVHGHHHVSRRTVESGLQGGALAEVAREPDGLHSRIVHRDRPQPGGRSVRTAVVHEDQLIRDRFVLQHLRELPIQGLDVLLLVEQGHDDADQRIRHRPSTSRTGPKENSPRRLSNLSSVRSRFR